MDIFPAVATCACVRIGLTIKHRNGSGSRTSI